MTLQELFDAVLSYKAKSREGIAPVNSVTGTMFGFTVVDSEDPAPIWEMSLKQAKAEAQQYEDSDTLIGLMSSYMGRVQLVQDLRSGALKLRPFLMVPVVVVPYQYYIPSL